jgi:hypothetical protein
MSTKCPSKLVTDSKTRSPMLSIRRGVVLGSSDRAVSSRATSAWMSPLPHWRGPRRVRSSLMVVRPRPETEGRRLCSGVKRRPKHRWRVHRTEQAMKHITIIAAGLALAVTSAQAAAKDARRVQRGHERQCVQRGCERLARRRPVLSRSSLPHRGHARAGRCMGARLAGR